MPDAVFRNIPCASIGLIQPLWEKLNALHLQGSPYFREHFERFTFEERIKPFLRMAPENILITVVEAAGPPVGYCVSSLHADGSGEIESLSLEPSLRGRGLGARLAGEHLAWLKGRRASPIRVSVAYGHESVFGFYEKLGFYPRATSLELKG